MAAQNVKPTVELTDEQIRLELERYKPGREERLEVLASCAVLFVVAVVVGIPLWWKTTTVYQADLPVDRIASLRSKLVQIQLPLSFVSFLPHKPSTSGDSLSAFGKQFCSQLARRTLGQDSHVALACSSTFGRQAADDELALLRGTFEQDQVADAERLDRLENLVVGSKHSHRDGSIASSSVYSILLISSDHIERLFSNLSDEIVVFKSPQSTTFILRSGPSTNPDVNIVYAFVSSPKSESVGWDDLSADLVKLVTQVLVPLEDPSSSSTSSGTPHQHLSASSVYEISLTLVPDSTKSNRGSGFVSSNHLDCPHPLMTDPTDWLQAMVEPAFARWNPHVKVNFYSQRLYAVDVENIKARGGFQRMEALTSLPRNLSPKWPVNGSVDEATSYCHLQFANAKERHYQQHDLSDIINKLESYQFGTISPKGAAKSADLIANVKQTINLVFLVTCQSESSVKPLRFRLFPPGLGSDVITDAAFVPKWGGLFVVDGMSDTESTPIMGNFSTNQGAALAQKVLSILRSHLGFVNIQSVGDGLDGTAVSKEFKLEALPALHLYRPAQWEMNRWFVQRTVESVATAKSTLISLANFLDRFPNIVINDEVAEQVFKATEILENLVAKKPQSTPFADMFTAAQQALGSANAAFFDHSLLDLLYFMEDQKYGIYVPLFMPIGLGVLVAAVKSLKIFTGRA